METLQDYRDQMAGTELGKQLETQVTRASRLRGGRNFWGIRIKSVAEMGDAAGTFHTGSKEVALRKDIVTTREGIAKACEVIVHEDIHKGNQAVGDTEQHSEGLVHFRTQRTLGIKDDIYDEEVSNIRAIAAEIGEDQVDRLGREKGAEVLLLSAFVQSKVKRGMNMDVATELGANHIRAAA